ncbi:MAG: DUF4416 family protein [Spirochaetales bacterium]|nr:MAG: DUF4416 family protein [Spirochaetales bacterium]
MGLEKNFEPWKLVTGLLLRSGNFPQLFTEAKNSLTEAFGSVDYESPALPFTYTGYYSGEMGHEILRVFLSFREPVDPSALSKIKMKTNALEHRFMEEEKRSVNIDPGILNLSRFILATTKDNAHRIPLDAGIYAELTLLYQRKNFQALPWTYPDFRTEVYQDILMEIRNIFREQLKQQSE